MEKKKASEGEKFSFFKKKKQSSSKDSKQKIDKQLLKELEQKLTTRKLTSDKPTTSSTTQSLGVFSPGYQYKTTSFDKTTLQKPKLPKPTPVKDKASLEQEQLEFIETYYPHLLHHLEEPVELDFSFSKKTSPKDNMELLVEQLLLYLIQQKLASQGKIKQPLPFPDLGRVDRITLEKAYRNATRILESSSQTIEEEPEEDFFVSLEDDTTMPTKSLEVKDRLPTKKLSMPPQVPTLEASKTSQLKKKNIEGIKHLTAPLSLNKIQQALHTKGIDLEGIILQLENIALSMPKALIYENLGLAYAKAGKVSDAIRAYKEYIKLSEKKGDIDGR